MSDTFRELKRTASVDRHFPLPLSYVDLAETAYDPTYGDSGVTTYEAAVCSTCAALVPYTHIELHAAWHDQESPTSSLADLDPPGPGPSLSDVLYAQREERPSSISDTEAERLADEAEKGYDLHLIFRRKEDNESSP